MVLGVKITIKIGKTKNGRETLGYETTRYARIDKTTVVAKENPCGVANF